MVLAKGIWDDLFNSHRVQEFTEIGVWGKNSYAHLSVQAKDHNYSNLGYIIENNVISHYLYQYVLANSNITIFSCEAIDSIY